MAGSEATAAVGATEALKIFNLTIKDFTLSVENGAGTIGRFRSVLEQTVGLFSPVSLLQFNRAVKDLNAVFGAIFLPVLQKVTDIVRTVADYFNSLPSAFKKIIAKLGEFTAIIGVVTILGSAIATLGVGMTFLANQAQYVYRLFSGTAGGAGALAKIGPLIEGIFGGIVAAVQKGWEVTAPFRQQLIPVFNQLGTALSQLFDAARPILGLVMEMVAAGVAGTIFLWTVAMKVAVRIITGLTTAITRLLGPLGQWLGMMGFTLPNMTRPNQSAFGMGFGGATVSNPADVYNRLTEAIAAGSRAPSRNYMEEISSNTDASMRALTFIGDVMKEIQNRLRRDAQELEAGGKGFVEGAVGPGAWDILRGMVGGIGGF